MRRRKNDDDDDHRILRDGERRRIPMMMRDEDSLSPLQRAIMQDAQETGRDQMLHDASAPGLITDAFGDTGAGLHRPGYRFQQPGERATESARMRDEAYRQHEAEEERRWRLQGSDREIEVEPITGDSLQDSYAAYDFYMSNAWRGPANKW